MTDTVTTHSAASLPSWTVAKRGVQVSTGLMRRVKLLVSKKPTEAGMTTDQQYALNKLAGQYETACCLSSGPDQARAEYWSEKARDFERRLTTRIERFDTGGQFSAKRER